MNISTGLLNRNHATQIIETLVELGVSYFCIAPGSRSSALVLACTHHECFVHWDERALGFHALGVAKASNRVVAIIVTSGTAVANLLPAVIEAHQERIPLVLLTADRPPERRDCGANQTIDQVGLFSSFCRWECDLPCPSPELPERFLSATIAYALFRAQGPSKGPVHLNCMLRKPFTTREEACLSSVRVPVYVPSEGTPQPQAIRDWARLLNAHEKGICVIGSLPLDQELRPLVHVAQALGWPIFADLLSSVRSLGEQEGVVPFYEHVLEQHNPNVVLHLGDRLTSAALQTFLNGLTPAYYFQVTNHPNRQDPYHLVTHRMECDVTQFCKEILPCLPKRVYTGVPIPDLREELEKLPLGEASLPYHLAAWGGNASFFFSNSMTIRYAEHYFFPKLATGRCIGMRGASGIDGNLAYVSGLSAGGIGPLVACFGDLSVLHDLTSLALVASCKSPVHLLVINNQGGGIFSFLPIAEQTEVLERFWETPHSYSFAQAASFFGLAYREVKNREELYAALAQQDHPMLIELKTDRKESVKIQACLQGISRPRGDGRGRV